MMLLSTDEESTSGGGTMMADKNSSDGGTSPALSSGGEDSGSLRNIGKQNTRTDLATWDSGRDESAHEHVEENQKHHQHRCVEYILSLILNMCTVAR
jgi:hypothetical protein